MVKEWKGNNKKKQTGKYQDPQKTKVSTETYLTRGVGRGWTAVRQNTSIEAVMQYDKAKSCEL